MGRDIKKGIEGKINEPSRFSGEQASLSLRNSVNEVLKSEMNLDEINRQTLGEHTRRFAKDPAIKSLLKPSAGQKTGARYFLIDEKCAEAARKRMKLLLGAKPLSALARAELEKLCKEGETVANYAVARLTRAAAEDSIMSRYVETTGEGLARRYTITDRNAIPAAAERIRQIIKETSAKPRSMPYLREIVRKAMMEIGGSKEQPASGSEAYYSQMCIKDENVARLFSSGSDAGRGRKYKATDEKAALEAVKKFIEERKKYDSRKLLPTLRDVIRQQVMEAEGSKAQPDVNTIDCLSSAIRSDPEAASHLAEEGSGKGLRYTIIDETHIEPLKERIKLILERKAKPKHKKRGMSLDERIGRVKKDLDAIIRSRDKRVDVKSARQMIHEADSIISEFMTLQEYIETEHPEMLEGNGKTSRLNRLSYIRETLHKEGIVPKRSKRYMHSASYFRRNDQETKRRICSLLAERYDSKNHVFIQKRPLSYQQIFKKVAAEAIGDETMPNSHAMTAWAKEIDRLGYVKLETGQNSNGIRYKVIDAEKTEEELRKFMHEFAERRKQKKHALSQIITEEWANAKGVSRKRAFNKIRLIKDEFAADETLAKIVYAEIDGKGRVSHWIPDDTNVEAARRRIREIIAMPRLPWEVPTLPQLAAERWGKKAGIEISEQVSRQYAKEYRTYSEIKPLIRKRGMATVPKSPECLEELSGKIDRLIEKEISFPEAYLISQRQNMFLGIAGGARPARAKSIILSAAMEGIFPNTAELDEAMKYSLAEDNETAKRLLEYADRNYSPEGIRKTKKPSAKSPRHEQKTEDPAENARNANVPEYAIRKAQNKFTLDSITGLYQQHQSKKERADLDKIFRVFEPEEYSICVSNMMQGRDMPTAHPSFFPHMNRYEKGVAYLLYRIEAKKENARRKSLSHSERAEERQKRMGKGW